MNEVAPAIQSAPQFFTRRDASCGQGVAIAKRIVLCLQLDTAVAAAYGWNDFVEILEHTGPGQIYDFDEGGWLVLDTDLEGYIAEMEKFRKEFDERILEL